MRILKTFQSSSALFLAVCLTLGFTALAAYAGDAGRSPSAAAPEMEKYLRVDTLESPDSDRPSYAPKDTLTEANGPKRANAAPDAYTAPAANAAHSGWPSPAPAPVDDAEEIPGPIPGRKAEIPAPHSADHGKLNDVDSEAALERLKRGNLRFQQGKFRRLGEGMSAKDRNRLLAGQQPHTLILSCSDSRVPPELVFDQRLGEVFVVRSAGESLDSAVLASVEYAVSHLGVQLVLVMGHDSCGAVNAALGTMPGAKSGSPYIDFMVADIQPRIASSLRQPASTGLVRESSANARGAVRDLIQKSSLLNERVKSGKLQVRSALYHLDTGSVDFD